MFNVSNCYICYSHDSLKQNKNDTYIESACSSCASLVAWKVSVSATKVCNIPQIYLIFYIATYSEHMHNSDKFVSHSVAYFLKITGHFNQVGILHKTSCVRTTGDLQSTFHILCFCLSLDCHFSNVNSRHFLETQNL
jgi:hypothetical protein